MATIALSLAPTLTVALSLVGGGSLASFTQLPAGELSTLTIAADQTVVAMVGEVLRGPRGLPGAPGPAGSAGLMLTDVELIASLEAEELRIDMDALVLATLSI